MKELFNYYQNTKTDDFEDVDIATKELDDYLQSQGLNNNVVDAIREKALLLSSAYEMQGFCYGMSKGLKMQKEADCLNERK